MQTSLSFCRNQTSWMHPRSKHRHLIDYTIVRRTDRQDVRATKTKCGADCWTDHRLVVSKLSQRIQPARRPQGKKASKRLDVSKLNQDSMRQAFLTDICNQLDAINLSSENPEEKWTVFHKVVHSSAATTLGHLSRKHQDWFDENDDDIQRLLEKKKNTDCTRHIKMILAQYLRKQPTATFVRQSRPSLGTSKSPG